MTDPQDFRVPLGAVDSVGSDLRRPECVLALSDGTLLSSDKRGQAAHLDPDGRLIRILGRPGGTPNGLALAADGTLLVADIGRGRVEAIAPDGRQSTKLETFGNEPLGACNFVLADPRDGYWLSVSSRIMPVGEAINCRARDGVVFRATESGLERVIDGLDFANEMRLSADGTALFVAETLAGRVSRAEVATDGSVGPIEPYGPDPLYEGALIDGIAMDVAGNVWVTDLSQNAILVIRPDRQVVTVVADPDGERLRQPTSVAFGGEDRQTVYVGSLRMNRLASFKAPLAGAPLAHWRSPRR